MNRSIFVFPVLFAWSLLLILLPCAGTTEESDPRLIIDPRGPSGQVWKLLFTPGGDTLVSLGDDKAIRFWDVDSGELQKTLRLEIGDGHEGKFFAGALSPDGRWLAVGGWAQTRDSQYGQIRVIDLETSEVAALLEGHTSVINVVDFSDDGRWLASGSSDDSVRVWDLNRLMQRKPGNVEKITDSTELQGHKAKVFAVDIAPGGDRLISGAYDHTLILWERTGESKFVRKATLEKHTAEVQSAAYSPDGKYIVSGGDDHQLLLWDGRTGAYIRALEEDMEHTARAITFSPDSQKVVASSQRSNSGYIAIYEIPSGQRVTRFDEHNNLVIASAWRPDGDLVATAGGDDNDIYLWRSNTGEVVHHLRGDGRAGWSVAFGDEGLKVAFGQQSSTTGFVKDAPLQQIFDFTNFTLEELPESQRSDPNGFRRTIMEKGGKNLKYIDSYHLETGSGTIEHDPSRYDRIRFYSFTPGGEVVVVADFSLKLHQSSGESIREFVGHEGVVFAVSPSPDGRYLASASYDQTVRLWNMHTGDLLASLFVARDGEWVCWTPSGHYHASAGGEKYIGWHINKGIDQVADYYPSYVFREQFHHPQLVKRTVLLGDFDKALAEVGDTRAPELADVLPPRIDWIFPQTTRGGASGSSVTVKANITSPNAGLEEVKLLVNGKAVKSDFRVSGNSLSYEQTIDLLPGENRLSLFARNTKAGHTSDERVVTVASSEPKPLTNVTQPIDSTGLDDLLKPNLYVLAVGVSEYQVKDIPTLEYCDDDAKAIAKFFEEQEDGIFGKVEVKLLTNKDATEREVQKSLNWLEGNATQKDVVVLFLAAHGINDDKGNFYLLPHDADMELLRSTAVAWDDFGDILGNLPSRVLMFLDTCHSGQLGAQLFTLASNSGTRSRSVGGLKSAFDPTEAIRELTSDENGVIIMAASTGDEESVESDNWGHGAFTMGLLEGFKGKADVNNDGIVHLRELDFFVADHVKLLTGGRQHPTTVKPSTISRLPVARVK